VATFHKRAGAKRDLIEHYVYLGEHAGIETVERFLANAGESFEDLSRNPAMGAPLYLRSPKLAGLRKWRVGGFENFPILYLPRPDRSPRRSRRPCHEQSTD
jgi:toxin ParE1/3/4